MTISTKIWECACTTAASRSSLGDGPATERVPVDDSSFVSGAGIPLGGKAGFFVEDLLDEVFLVVRVDLCGDTIGRVLAGSVGNFPYTLTFTDTKTGETWDYDEGSVGGGFFACP